MITVISAEQKKGVSQCRIHHYSIIKIKCHSDITNPMSLKPNFKEKCFTAADG